MFMRSVLAILFCTLFVFGSSAFGQLDGSLTLEKGLTPHREIDDIYKRFSEGYRKLAPEAVANLYTEDAFYLSPGNEVTRGRDKILASFKGFFGAVKNSGGNLSISFRILDRRVSGDLAYDVGIYMLKNRSPSGEERTSRGKFNVVALRLKDGDWRFHVDSYSDLPDPKEGARQNTVSADDLAAIRQTALDYVESWYEGNAERMERALHPDLAKRIVQTNDKGQSRLDQMSAMGLVQGTRRGYGKDTPKEKRQKDVIILDVFENAASVKAVMSGWIDYMHMAKYNGRWVIVNVLWELKPKTVQKHD